MEGREGRKNSERSKRSTDLMERRDNKKYQTDIYQFSGVERKLANSDGSKRATNMMDGTESKNTLKEETNLQVG